MIAQVSLHDKADGPVGRRRLIFRLSSMGDVILASAALAAGRSGDQTDWVVAKEYAGLLSGHPGIRRVWAFDRRAGFRAWVSLCTELARSGDYDEVLDLHSSLRTQLARWVFACTSKKSPVWTSIAKSRGRRLGYFLAKAKWPATLRPTPLAKQFAMLAGGSGQERPDLRHLLAPLDSHSVAITPNDAKKIAEFTPSYICVMPGARWPGKRWPVEKYAAVLKRLGRPVVIFGAERDQESSALAGLMEKERCLPLLGERSFAELATVLAGSAGYLGNDTGLAHLAEAVGVPALMVFGPTTPELGFGPWRAESRAIGAPLWCRPCGKDGRACFRRGEKRYLCLTSLDPREVEEVARGIWGAP